MANPADAVTVHCGANEHVLEDGVGLTPAEIRTRLAELLNVPLTGQAVVTGQAVSDTEYRLQAGDVLEFVQPAGAKASL